MLLVSLASGVGYTFTLDGQDPAEGWLFVVVVLSSASAVALWWRRRFPVAVTLVTLVGAVITGLPVAVSFALLTLTIRRRDLLVSLRQRAETAEAERELRADQV